MKLCTALLAFAASLAIAAIAVPSAFATTPEWLFSGSKLTVALSTSTSGEFTLTDTKRMIGVTCDYQAVGTVGPGSVDLVEKIEGLTLPAEETTLNCSGQSGTLCAGGSAEAKAVNLPWESELTLSEGAFRDLLLTSSAGKPGFTIVCDAPILGLVTEECVGNTSTAVQNVTGGVETSFDAASATLNCSVGGEGAGKLSGSADVTAPLGALSVSEE